MSSGQGPSDLFLEADSTRLVPRLDVVSGSGTSDGRITLDSQTGRVRIDAVGGLFAATASNGAQVGQFAAAEDEAFGFLLLREDSGEKTVTVGIEEDRSDRLVGGFLNVWNGDRKTFEIQHRPSEDQWRFVLRGTDSATPYTVARAGTGGSLLAVRNENHTPTGEMLGDDGALELTRPAGTTGGGELVLGEYPDAQQFDGDAEQYVETLTEEPGEVERDVHVQLSADAERGREQRSPRLYAEGPEATLHVGRAEGEAIEEAVAGTVRLRDSAGAPSIDVRGSNAGITLSRGTGGESDEMGTIAASAAGLNFEDPSGNPVLRFEPDAIQTQNGIDEATLQTPAKFQQDTYEVMRYNVAEIDVFVDNQDRVQFAVATVPDPFKRTVNDDGVLLRGTIVPGDTDTVTLLLNTRVLGDEDSFAPAVEVDGDATLERVSETSLADPPIDAGQLEIQVPDDTATLNVTPVEEYSEFAQSSYSVDAGDTVTFDIFVDNFDSVVFRINAGGYSLRATILPADSDVVTLAFDTSLAGDSTSPTPLTTAGAATVVVESETNLSDPPIEPANYELLLPDFDIATLQVLASS